MSNLDKIRMLEFFLSECSPSKAFICGTLKSHFPESDILELVKELAEFAKRNLGSFVLFDDFVQGYSFFYSIHGSNVRMWNGDYLRAKKEHVKRFIESLKK